MRRIGGQTGVYLQFKAVARHYGGWRVVTEHNVVTCAVPEIARIGAGANGLGAVRQRGTFLVSLGGHIIGNRHPN